MIMDHYGFSVDELTPSDVNKIIGFELSFRSLGCIPTFWVFNYLLYLTMNSGVRTLAKRQGVHQLISEQDVPKKIWQRQWLWVDWDLQLGGITIVGENWEDSDLGPDGAEAKIYVEMDLCSDYQGRLYHREVDLVEALPLPESERCMRDLAGFLSVEGGNAGSSGHTSWKHWGCSRQQVFNVCREVKVVIPNSMTLPPLTFATAYPIDLNYESTFGGILVSPRASVQLKKPSANDKIGIAPNTSCSKAYAPGWAITGHYLLSDDTIDRNGVFYSQSSASMRFLAGKFGVQVVGDLCYAIARASNMMVAAADRVYRVGVTESWLRPLCNTIVSLKEQFSWLFTPCL
ncbi:unnamed protein product [Lactuca saligna]|uniref:Uncharacterized protein n=1 Tax=Lactuca saligna TaxID=75948 RepID=A0AA35Z0T3_LACSI|nr:unnamed protein product [Lactuca saligna]